MNDRTKRKRWFVEQRIDLPGMGEWLVYHRCLTETEAQARRADLEVSASPLEAFRVRDADNRETQLDLLEAAWIPSV